MLGRRKNGNHKYGFDFLVSRNNKVYKAAILDAIDRCLFGDIMDGDLFCGFQGVKLPAWASSWGKGWLVINTN